MSESLKKNRTLTKLNLNSRDKRKAQKHPKEIVFKLNHIDNIINHAGARVMSEALVINTSLTVLKLKRMYRKAHKLCF